MTTNIMTIDQDKDRDAPSQSDTASLEVDDTAADVTQFMGSAVSDQDGFSSKGFEVSEYDDDQDLASVPLQTNDTLKKADQLEVESSSAPAGDAGDAEPTDVDNVDRQEMVIEEITVEQVAAEIEHDDGLESGSEMQPRPDSSGDDAAKILTSRGGVHAKDPQVAAQAQRLFEVETEEADSGPSDVVEAPRSNRVMGIDAPSTDFNSFSETFSHEDDSGGFSFAGSDEPEEDQPGEDEKIAPTQSDTDRPEIENTDQDYGKDDAERARDDVDDLDHHDNQSDNGIEAREAREARIARRKAISQDEDEALERLMDATSSRLEDSENSGRRASIAHLKAAVAATKADASIVEGAAAKEEAELHQYREDLARVVRPGGEASTAPDTARRTANAPSPLVLVSEQRIEDDEDQRTASMLASVAATAAQTATPADTQTASDIAEEATEDGENIFNDREEHESFSDFAERFGSGELPMLFEAAAAHFSVVEDIESFTRPMLMRKVTESSVGQTVTREDGLRAFGTLLREGRILKDQNGRFTISSTSKFLEQSGDIMVRARP